MIARIHILFAALFLFSCNDEPLGPFTVDEKILITNSEGQIIGGNYNDWRVQNPITGLQLQSPPFPNPTQNSACAIKFSSSRERLRAYIEYPDGTQDIFFIPTNSSVTHYIYGPGFDNEVQFIKVYVKDTLFTSGHIQFD